ncbi:MAG: Lrp/AsnC family transcriptional regulator [Aquabacterium sp.]
MQSANNSLLDEQDLKLLDLLQHDANRSNQDLAELAHMSPATCHRRVKRLREEGFIEKQVAVLSHQRMADALGWGLAALVEISLDVQTQEALDAFEKRALAAPEVQQCWRVSPGPDFVLVLQVADMPAYQEVARQLFTQESLVRHVRAFFSVKRAKFDTRLPLPAIGLGRTA